MPKLLRILLLLFLAPFSANSFVIYVPYDSTTIQEGIDGCIDGDTVMIANGTYTGEGNRDLDFAGKKIVVMSINGPENVIIDCEGSETNRTSGVIFNSGTSPQAELNGITITNSNGYYAAIDYSGDDSATVKNCIIRDNTTNGIRCGWNSQPNIEDCIITNNTDDGVIVINELYMSGSLIAFNGGNGFQHINHDPVEITNCTFAFNGLTGVNFFGDPPKDADKMAIDSTIVKNCISAFNGEYGFDQTFYLGQVFLECNGAYGNTVGDFDIYGYSDGDEFGNITADPMFCDTTFIDFHLDAESPCAAHNNSCGELIGAYDYACNIVYRTWNVTADGFGDAPTIQAAIDSAISGDTIMVGPGTYTGDGNRDIDLADKSLIIASTNGVDATIIDCEGTESENHNGINITGGQDTSTVIDGFTVTGAYMDYYEYKGAIFISNATPIIRNCKAIDNFANAGIYCYSPWPWPDSAYIENCEASGNSMDGIAMTGAVVVVNNCIVHNNEGNGVVSYWNCPTYLTNSVLYGNGVAGVSAITMYSDFHVTNNTIYNNNDGLVWFDNYPKSGGKPPEEPAYDNFDVSNNIIAFNQNYGIYALYDFSEATDSITMCNNVYGNVTGDFGLITNHAGDDYGNISEDPLFCDTLNLDLHIDATSPSAPANNSCGVLMGALPTGCGELCGDVNGDGNINIIDVTSMIVCLYQTLNCPEPVDVNGDGAKNILDITFLISYLYQGGPAPEC